MKKAEEKKIEKEKCMSGSSSKIETNLYSTRTQILSFIVNLIDFFVSQNRNKREREREKKKKQEKKRSEKDVRGYCSCVR